VPASSCPPGRPVDNQMLIDRALRNPLLNTRLVNSGACAATNFALAERSSGGSERSAAG
jgi:hypothetical protein